MTEKAEGESICSQVERLITDFEHSKDPDSTEIGRQFAVRNFSHSSLSLLIRSLFQQLQQIMIENQEILSCHEGAKAINRFKNRYKDVLPCK